MDSIKKYFSNSALGEIKLSPNKKAESKSPGLQMFSCLLTKELIWVVTYFAGLGFLLRNIGILVDYTKFILKDSSQNLKDMWLVLYSVFSGEM